MPTIGEMSHGYNTSGVENYIAELKAIVLTEAAEEIKNIDEIRTACEANWEGQARENFLNNVKLDAEHVAEQYNQLYNILQTEINNVQNAMSNFDYNLIDKN